MRVEARGAFRRRHRLLAVAGAVALVAASLGLVAAAPPSSAASGTVADDFASYDFAGSTGSLPWASDWIDSEGDGPAAGAVRVEDEPQCLVNPCLHIGKRGSDDASVERAVDLSGATAAELTFDYKIHRHNGGDGEVWLRLSDDGGGSWDTLRTYDLTADSGPNAEVVDLTLYATALTRLRFELVGGSGDSHLNANNLAITFTDEPPAPILVSEFSSRGAAEFIELYNAGAGAVDIDGYELQVDNGGTVTDITVSQGGGSVILPAGGHYLLADGGGALAGTADQTFPFGLMSDIGIRVRDDLGRLTDQVGAGATTWFEGWPLPRMQAGPTQSYERLNSGGLGNCVDTGDNRADFVHNWGVMNPQNLTSPPVACGVPSAHSHMVISEFRPEGPAGADDEFVELFNPTTSNVDISGWVLHVTEPGLFRDYHVVPVGTVLKPGEHYLVSDTDGPTPANAHPFDVATDYVSSWGDVVLKDESGAVVDAFGYGDTGNGQLYEGTASPSYDAGTADRSFARRNGGFADTDDNEFDFVFSFEASPMWSNQAPVFDQDLGDRSDAEGTLISLPASATDPNPGDSLTYAASGLPEGVQIDDVTGTISGALGPNGAGVHTVTITVTDDATPSLQDVDTFVWTVVSGQVHYLIPGLGGGAGGDDLLTAVNPDDLSSSTNEVDVGDGTGTTNIDGAAVQHTTGAIYAADDGQLGIIDPTTGVFAATAAAFGSGNGSVGMVTFDDVDGIAFDPLTGDLYAVHQRSGAEGVLFRVDPATGAAIGGAFGGDDYVVLPEVSAGAGSIMDVAIHPTTREAYGVFTSGFGWFIGAIDLETGATTLVGSTATVRGLSFDASGQLWGVGSTFSSRMYEIDTGDGSASNARTVNNGSFYEAMAFSAPPLLNRPPVFNQDLGDRTDPEGAAVSFSAAATDPDFDPLDYSATGLPPGIAVDPTTGAISGTIDDLAGSGSPYGVVVTVNDDGDGTATDSFTWTVTDVNRPPVLDPLSDDTVDEATPITFTATATDPDLDGLTFSVAAAPAGAAIDPATGVFTWTPAEAQHGVHAFDVLVADDGAPVLTDSQTISITVNETNQAPVLTDPGNRTNGEGDPVNYPLAATDEDDPANTLTFAAVGLPPGLSIDPGSGVVSGTVDPLAAAGSPYTVTLSVFDDGVPALSDQVVITWTITDTNRSPTLDPVGDHSVAENTLISFTATGSDPDFDTIVFSLSGEPAGASIDPVSGVFTWTPTEAQGPGAYSFDVVVADDGAPALQAAETITITVGESNQTPVLADPGAQSHAEGSVVSVTVTATDADAPANTLTFSATGLPPGLNIDPSSGEITGTVDPLAAAGSPYSVTLTVTDDGTPALQDQVVITWTITETNRPPVLDPLADVVADEETLITFTATGSDPDGNNLVFSLAGEPGGAAIDSVSGVFTWTPAEGQDGPHTFDVVVSDDGAPVMSDSRTITITVEEVNRAPVLDPLVDPTGDEETLITFTASGSDPDAPANTLGYYVSGAPAGATIDPATGVFTWTPSETQDGAHTFDVVVADDGIPELFDTRSITVNVNEVNRAPVVVDPGAQSRSEGDVVTLAIEATDADVPANTVTWNATGLPPGLSIDPASGVIGGTVDSLAAAGSPYTTTITATDDGSPSLQDQVVVIWTVTDTNRSPTLDPIGDHGGVEESPVTFTATASDPDLDTLAFSLTGEPLGALIDPVSGVLTWTPTESQGPGSYTFDVVVTDDGAPPLADAETITITVGEVNRAPVIADPGAQAHAEGSTVAVGLAATDADLPANALTFSATGLPPGLTVDPTSGVVSGVVDPLAASGSPYSVTATVTDDGTPALLDQVVIVWTITDTNRAPALDPIVDLVGDEETLLTFVATGDDPDGDALSFSLAGAPSGAAIDAGSGLFTWTPTEAQDGTYAFDVVVVDDGALALSATHSVTITVEEVNKAPLLDPIPDLVGPEETPIVFTAAGSDPDVPANGLMFTVAGEPAGAVIDAVSGAFTWTPTETQGPGTYTFDVMLTDDGVPTFTAVQTVTVTVKESNRAPSLSPPADRTDVEGNSLLMTLTAVDGDVPANALTFGATGLPPGLSVDANTGIISGTIGTAAAAGSPYAVSVSVADDGAPSLDDRAVFTWIVERPNHDPIVSPVPPMTVEVDSLVTFVVAASDPDGDPITFGLGAAAPAGATLVPATGWFAWTPAEAGSYGFTVEASDGRGGVGSALVTIEVETGNQSPLADDVTASVLEDGTVTFGWDAIDPDDDELTFEVVGVPRLGNVQPFGDGARYTPRPDATGLDTFEYTATDPHGASDAGFVSITIIAVNDAPVARADDYREEWAEEIVVKAPGVLGNDRDVDDLGLEARVVTPPDQGTVVLAGDGGFVYRPPVGFAGQVSFRYEAVDAAAAGSEALATITVEALPGVASPTRRSVVDSIVAFEPADDPVATTEVLGATDPVTVQRTLVLMSRAGGIAAQQMGFPFLFLLVAFAVVLILGRLRVIPLVGRRRSGSGTVTMYSAEHGFGLVMPDGDDVEVFVHRVAIRRGDRSTIQPGNRVRYRWVPGEYRNFVTRLRAE